jgi:uncharacterized protein YbcI
LSTDEVLHEPRPLNEDGDTLAAISRRIVRLYKEHYGKGPTRARTYHWRDLVVVLLRDGFTPLEKTLEGQSGPDRVRDLRAELQRAMTERFEQVVEEELRREVIAFLSASHSDPDLHAEIFVLAPEREAQDKFERAHGAANRDGGAPTAAGERWAADRDGGASTAARGRPAANHDGKLAAGEIRQGGSP